MFFYGHSWRMSRNFITSNRPFKLGLFRTAPCAHVLQGLSTNLNFQNSAYRKDRRSLVHLSNRVRTTFNAASLWRAYSICDLQFNYPPAEGRSTGSAAFIEYASSFLRRLMQETASIKDESSQFPADSLIETDISVAVSHTSIDQCIKGDSVSSSPAGCSSAQVKEKNSDPGMSQHKVGHDQNQHFFYIKMQGQSSDQQEAKAILEYSYVQPGVVDMYHTLVPPEFRGQGIAKILTEAALDFFSEQNVVIRPTCTYIRKYLRENPNPRYIDRIEKDFEL